MRNDGVDAMSPEVWWNRPALSMAWRESCVEESIDNLDLSRALLPWFRDQDLKQSAESLPIRTKCMDYCVFMHLCAYLTEQLLLLLPGNEDHGTDTLKQSRRPTLIVVAIPQGPFLPLGVTAAHVINATPHRSILIPIDPSQAGVLATPAFFDEDLMILVATNCDQQRMELALAAPSSKTKRCKYSIHNLQELLPSLESLPFNASPALPPSLRNNAARSTQQQSVSLVHAIAACGKKSNPLIQLDDACTSGEEDWISHIVFTSGTTTGKPKGCVNSRHALMHYLSAKNTAHGIQTAKSAVYLASSIAFDPCFSDCLATFTARATLVLPPFHPVLQRSITHVLCTPTQWKSYNWSTSQNVVAGEAGCEQRRENLVVALGGESIPEHMRLHTSAKAQSGGTRLLATYGVTEACVYQTVGVVAESKQKGFVGRPLSGMHVAIWKEETNDGTNATALPSYQPLGEDDVGEVVLSGTQLNSLSGYFKQPDLTKRKFVRFNGQMHYRTGDRGFVKDGALFLLGRITGDDMVKLNGVRVQLGDIEEALLSLKGVVDDAMVVGHTPHDGNATTSVSELHAYIVLHPDCWAELVHLGGDQCIPSSGLLCSSRPLLELLQRCCQINTRVIPSVILVLDKMPTTSTGKRNPRGLPPIHLAKAMENMDGGVALADYGRSGTFVANEIRDRLNLLPAQEGLMTTKSSYALLGGDSLTATQIVRSLYARHSNIRDSRHLGGSFGNLEGFFAPRHLLSASNLGNYVDWLDQNDAFTNNEENDRNQTLEERSSAEPSKSSAEGEVEFSALHDALMQCCSLRYNAIARCLLSFTDPNLGSGRFRMAKTSRLDRKIRFRPSPLHVACFHGNLKLTMTLLDHGAKYNIPNPSGFFPLHLAASGEYRSGEDMPLQEQEDRLACVKLLLDAGAPRTMADGNKQSVLHAAARTGNALTLEYLSRDWNEHSRKMGLEWRDNWARTPLHWAVLNGHRKALSVLLDAGSHPNPPAIPSARTNTSLVTETPLEICRRVHGRSPSGICMEELILNAMAKLQSAKNETARSFQA